MYEERIEWQEAPGSVYSVIVQGNDKRRTIESAQAVWDQLDAIGYRLFTSRPAVPSKE